MAAETGRRPSNTPVDTLLRRGRTALQRGNRRRAHALWREAATVDPYDERVWQALLTVVETPDDRRVCLENILAINPLNTEARRQLRALSRLSGDSPNK